MFTLFESGRILHQHHRIVGHQFDNGQEVTLVDEVEDKRLGADSHVDTLEDTLEATLGIRFTHTRLGQPRGEWYAQREARLRAGIVDSDEHL